MRMTSAYAAPRWRTAKLADVLTVVRGVSYKKEDASLEPSPGLIPILRATNIQNGLVLDDFVHVPRRYVSDEQLLRRGDIVVAASSGSRSVVGKAAQLTVNWTGSFGTFCFGLRPKPSVHPAYLAWFLQTSEYRRQVSELSAGVNINNLRVAHIEEIPIPLAPDDEQESIVAEIEKQLTRLDAGVAALRRVQANLKRYRAAVLKAACEGRLVPTECEWEETTIGQVATVRAGYGFPERLQGRPMGDFGFYKVGDISEAWKRNGKVLTRANHYVSRADLDELRAKLLPPGTVVFAKIGAAIALNRRAIIGEPSLVDNNVMGLHAGDRVAPRYLFHFLCTQKLDDLARATTVPSIRKGDVEGIELKLPALDEQIRIVAEIERRLSVVDDLEAAVVANLQRATRLRQSVLQKAFAGELSTDEPPSSSG